MGVGGCRIGNHLAFVLGRKGKQAAKEEVELKEKEIEVINYASEKEAKKKSEALEKYLRETARLREEYKSAETSLKKKLLNANWNY